MWIPRLRTVALVSLLALLAAVLGRSPGDSRAAGSKPAITLPQDSQAVVLSYDPGAGGFLRKGPPPYLKIQADGQVTVCSPFDGSKKESKLTATQLQELLRFIIQDNNF